MMGETILYVVLIAARTRIVMRDVLVTQANTQLLIQVQPRASGLKPVAEAVLAKSRNRKMTLKKTV